MYNFTKKKTENKLHEIYFPDRSKGLKRTKPPTPIKIQIPPILIKIKISLLGTILKNFPVLQ